MQTKEKAAFINEEVFALLEKSLPAKHRPIAYLAFYGAESLGRIVCMKKGDIPEGIDPEFDRLILEAKQKSEEWLFPRPGGDNHISRSCFDKALRKAAKELNIKINPGILSRSFLASKLPAIYHISRQLRHV